MAIHAAFHATVDAILQRVDRALSRAVLWELPQTPVSGMAYGRLPPCRWQFWQVRLLPAKRLAGSDTAGPISLAVSVKSAYPYLTSEPNGSSATAAISGDVHWVRSMSTLHTVGRLGAAIKAGAHKQDEPRVFHSALSIEPASAPADVDSSSPCAQVSMLGFGRR